MKQIGLTGVCRVCVLYNRRVRIWSSCSRIQEGKKVQINFRW